MHRAQDLLVRWPALDVATKRIRIQSSFHFTPGSIGEAVTAAMADAERAAAGLWRREASVWSDDPALQEKIDNRLGWLNSPLTMADAITGLSAFAASIKQAGFRDVLVLGMGGSSLAPEVLRAVIGSAPGWPRLSVLDSTDPDAIRSATTAPEGTLYVFASKSGTTIEPNALAAHFRQELEDAGVTRWADHFVAITDPGTVLERRARADGYREVFVNPPDVGGRYSALSYFGLVPAALMGHNLASLLGWGLAMLAASEPGTGSALTNPAVGLGLALGAAARAGRDKLTLLLPPALEPFGLWVEQLVAESTGKLGRGIVPVAGESLGAPKSYDRDRLFVRIRLHGSYGEDMRDSEIQPIASSGVPYAGIDLAEPSALGAEFVRWEIATAVAGALLRVNPFDEPNVQQAKDATSRLLSEVRAHGQIPASPSDRTVDGVTLTLSRAAREALGRPTPEAVLTLLRPGDYFALLAYLGPQQEVLAELQAWRLAVRDRTGVATTLGYGPRYLHSTGQLHKGGPNTGVFVIVTAEPRADLPVPREGFSFGTLELAQALGDFRSLDEAGRRVLHAHLPGADRRQIRALAGTLLERVRPRGGQ